MQYVTGPLFRFVELAGWINELTMYAVPSYSYSSHGQFDVERDLLHFLRQICW